MLLLIRIIPKGYQFECTRTTNNILLVIDNSVHTIITMKLPTNI